MKVILSAAAKADLVEIGDFIAADSRQRARTFVDELVACCRQLATMPRAFPLVPHQKAAGVRRRPYRDYVIFYRIEDEPCRCCMCCTGRATTIGCCSRNDRFWADLSLCLHRSACVARRTCATLRQPDRGGSALFCDAADGAVT